MRFSRTALTIGVAALMPFLAQAALTDLLPPDAKIVAGVSLRGLLDSPLLKSFGDTKATTSQFLAGSPLALLDPLKDIDDVIVASSGEGQNGPALIVLHGRFTPQLLPPGSKTYEGVTIFEDAKKPNGSVALLDANTLIAGDLKMVRAAIDRRGRSSSLPPALAVRVQDLQSRFDVWGVGDLPKDWLTSASSAVPSGAVPAAPAELQAIDHFEFGASLRHGLELSGQIHVRSSKEAEKMMQTLKLVEAMVRMQQPANSATKFDLQSGDNTFKLSLSIPEEELLKGIARQKANLASSMASGFQSPAPKPTIITTTPTPGSVVKNEKGDSVMVTLPRK